MFVARDWVIRKSVRRSWMVCMVATEVSEIHGGNGLLRTVRTLGMTKARCNGIYQCKCNSYEDDPRSSD